ncbi:tetratricopeptide repeat family protein [Naegleria gruberi]|uniref:Tetratricopeptide repeat family protein n=1 Tax=Naegleria gruberi TaxID=5762 RepID=D2VQJ3_NAEGR|nr:tetratricopeptide repeat family protein [Naegleria gruberi]EFC40880.1 tetratricopeptide repeat family protein [Naegleria gruberi]|eukprot:XP_002673624.1 tetratricopeptide repeat family protein [Naegleria gruberi strain NEG-M]
MSSEQTSELKKSIEKINEEILKIEKDYQEQGDSNKVKLVSELSESYVNRATFHIALEDFKSGMDDLTQAVLFNPGNSQAWLMRALMNFEKFGNLQKSLEDYNKGIELDSTNVVALNNRCKIYLELKEFDKVLKDSSLVIDLLKLEGELGATVENGQLAYDPNEMFIKAHMNRVIALMGKGEFEKGLSDLSELIKRIPKDKLPKELANVYVYRGSLYEQLSQPEKALDDFNNAIKIDASNGDAWSSRAFSYIEKEEYGKAVNDFSKLIEIDPTNESSYRKRGNVYMVMEKFEEALKDINKSIELTSSDEKLKSALEESLKVRGAIYQNLGEFSKAIEDFQRAIELEPNNYDVLISIGNLYLNEENFNQALEYYEKAQTLQPSEELSKLIEKIKSGELNQEQPNSGSNCIIN